MRQLRPVCMESPSGERTPQYVGYMSEQIAKPLPSISSPVVNHERMSSGAACI